MSLPGMTQQRSAQLNQGATFSRRKLSLLDVCPLLTRCGRYLHKTWTFLDNHTPRRGNFSTPTYCSINLPTDEHCCGLLPHFVRYAANWKIAFHLHHYHQHHLSLFLSLCLSTYAIVCWVRLDRFCRVIIVIITVINKKNNIPWPCFVPTPCVLVPPSLKFWKVNLRRYDEVEPNGSDFCWDMWKRNNCGKLLILHLEIVCQSPRTRKNKAIIFHRFYHTRLFRSEADGRESSTKIGHILGDVLWVIVSNSLLISIKIFYAE